jgi:hypothetical protein
LAPTTSSTEGTTAVPATQFLPSSIHLSLSIYKWPFDLSKQCRFTIFTSNSTAFKLLKTTFLCCLQNDPPRNDNEEVDRAIAESLTEDVRTPKGTRMNPSFSHLRISCQQSMAVVSSRCCKLPCRAEKTRKGDKDDEDLARAIQDSLNMNPYTPYNPYAPSHAQPRGHRLAAARSFTSPFHHTTRHRCANKQNGSNVVRAHAAGCAQAASMR